jgi:hypothetical protein
LVPDYVDVNVKTYSIVIEGSFCIKVGTNGSKIVVTERALCNVQKPVHGS